jgi:sugar phosphate isomerase/epimerase
MWYLKWIAATPFTRGADPVQYLKNYPQRIHLLHLKDLKPGYGVSSSIDTEEKDTNAELGKGVIDWPQLFEVAKRGSVRHYFVEHEGRMDHPPLEAIENSLRYLKHSPEPAVVTAPHPLPRLNRRGVSVLFS